MGALKWGLKVAVHNCPRLLLIVVILRRKFPLHKGPISHKCAQSQTIVHKLASVALSRFESPHLDFPDFLCEIGRGIV